MISVELKHTVTKMKNSLKKFNGWPELAEIIINELKIDLYRLWRQRKKGMK